MPEPFGGSLRRMGRSKDETRLATSVAVKAARWLRGGVDEKGAATPLSVRELVAMEPVRANGIAKNRVEEIEQMTVDARPYEIATIGQALGIDMELLIALRSGDAAPARAVQTSEMLSEIAAQLTQIAGSLARRADATTEPAPAARRLPPVPGDELVRPPSGDQTTTPRRRRGGPRRAVDETKGARG